MPLYKIVHQHLEYCIQFSPAHLRKNENIQIKSMDMIRGIWQLPYRERLRRLGHSTFKIRLG